MLFAVLLLAICKTHGRHERRDVIAFSLRRHYTQPVCADYTLWSPISKVCDFTLLLLCKTKRLNCSQSVLVHSRNGLFVVTTREAAAISRDLKLQKKTKQKKLLLAWCRPSETGSTAREGI